MKHLAARLTLSYLLVIGITSVIFSVVGVQFIGNRVIAEAQAKVQLDLNAAREIYETNLDNVLQVVRFTAAHSHLRDAILAGRFETATEELVAAKNREGLDVLTVTDADGTVRARAGNPRNIGDSQADDEVVAAVLASSRPVAATALMSAAELGLESPFLPDQAYFELVDTPHARERADTEESAGMLLEAAAPILDGGGVLIGVLYGGVLLNRNFAIVDKIKQTVYQDMQYERVDIGTATIFQDDVRISTNVRNENGTRAVGTRASGEVYQRVVGEGELWIDRAYVVNSWYITAYEPIRDLNDQIIGMLYVGMLEEPYLDIKRRTSLLFLAISLTGACLAVVLGHVISKRFSVPLKALVGAAREVAAGNLDTRVVIRSDGEFAEMAQAFNTMAAKLKRRDEALKEFAKSKIMESERLAIIGQLAADVAHELNNPLQGIVAFSELLLEKTEPDDPRRGSLEKIATQANRCTTIIRGLLDFSRRREPNKRPSDICALLDECVGLVENQALFHDITIIKNCAPDIPPVIIDPSQIQQVFMNMIINAAESMNGNGGSLKLTTRLNPATNGIEASFADSGHGISEQNLERVFDPFFTTKEVGHGTGLGLAISYGIVKRHGGTISVESEQGRGTTFTVHLPGAAAGGREAA
jgi:two-component system NtrC family sensor kinase